MTELATQVKRNVRDLKRRAGDSPDVADLAVEVLRSPGLRAELGDTLRLAAIEVLKPVARRATQQAAAYAVTRGPDLVLERLVDAGGAGALVKGVAAKGGGLAGAAAGLASRVGGSGRGRRLPVQEYVDVGVDLQTAYDEFTQFEEWPRFMDRAERIERRDRVVWRSTRGPRTVGVVTFHALGDHLTRIAVTADLRPRGLFARARISRRALRSDLMRLTAFIELRGRGEPVHA